MYYYMDIPPSTAYPKLKLSLSPPKAIFQYIASTKAILISTRAPSFNYEAVSSNTIHHRPTPNSSIPYIIVLDISVIDTIAVMPYYLSQASLVKAYARILGPL